MNTTFSYSFQAKGADPAGDYRGERAIMSAGRWQTHLEAVKAASEWLLHMAGETQQQYSIEIVQVEELELL